MEKEYYGSGVAEALADFVGPIEGFNVGDGLFVTVGVFNC